MKSEYIQISRILKNYDLCEYCAGRLISKLVGKPSSKLVGKNISKNLVNHLAQNVMYVKIFLKILIHYYQIFLKNYLILILKPSILV